MLLLFFFFISDTLCFLFVGFGSFDNKDGGGWNVQKDNRDAYTSFGSRSDRGKSAFDRGSTRGR